jgi:type III secretory pathway component EscV
VSSDLRRFLAQFLAPRFPQLCVFAYPEVGRGVTLKPLTVMGAGLPAAGTEAARVS